MDKITLPGFSPYYGPTTGFSRAFQNLIKDVGDSKSKYEEDRIMQREIKYLRENLEKPNLQSKQMKENLMRMIYCEMLGHDASFGFIHAVNYTQKGRLKDKRLGYLACCILLHEDHELTLLLMNTMQKDLKSTNIMENCIALIAVCQLINKDMLPAVLPLVTKLVQHKREVVRKKAVMAMLRFHQLDSSSVTSITSIFQDTLCDRDPAVMGATLNVYLALVTDCPNDYKRFTTTFVNILKQIIEFRLPNEFTYYNVPAPWIQIKLFKILALLGNDDQRESEKIYEILKLCLETTYIENNIGCAVLSECLRTASALYPNKTLSELASRRVGLLLISKNNNLKYLGINILAHLIKVDVSYAFRHQMTVIDCLNDPDETLKRKTLVLLYRMTNASNVEKICDKMIHYLRSSVDEYLRADLVNRITTLAEKFAPDNEWFIETMNEVFELGGNLVRPQVAHNLMQLIGEGTDDEKLDNDLRLYAVNSYLDLIAKPAVPDILLQLMCWVIGEYSYLASHCDAEDVMEQLCTLFDRKHNDKTTKPWIVSAITKIVAQIGYLPDNIRDKVTDQMRLSDGIEMIQRCAELLCLFDAFPSLDEILPPDASCEDLEVDSTLSFLDGFVSDALANGAAPYKPKHMRDSEPVKQGEEHRFQIFNSAKRDIKKEASSLNVRPYPKQEAPKKIPYNEPAPSVIVAESRPIGTNSSVGGMVLPTGDFNSSPRNTRKPKKLVWGVTGYVGDKGKHGMADQDSESSSSTSEIGSGSQSSGKFSSEKHEETKWQTKPSTGTVTEDMEKIKLAEGLFPATLISQSDSPRSEKAGFSNRKRREARPRVSKHNSSSPSAEETSVAKTTNAKQPDSLLLLDFDDSGVGDSSGPEQIEINEIEKNAKQLLDENLLLEGPSLNASTLNVTSPGIFDAEKPGSTFKASSIDAEQPEDVNHTELNAGELGMQTVVEPLLPDINAPPLLNETQEADLMSNESDSQTLEQQQPVRDLLDSESPTYATEAIQAPERSFPTLPDELVKFSKSEMQTICEDTNIKLTSQKVMTPDNLTIVIFASNLKQHVLKDITIFLQPPSNLSSKLDNAKEMTTFDEVLNGWEYQRHILCMRFDSPSRNMMIGGHLSYKDASDTQKRLFINYQLSIFDFICPWRIDTQTYGQKWGSTGYEKRQQISWKNQTTLKDLLQIVEQKFHFQIVEIIGIEAITAGLVNSKEHCLLHVKFTPSSIELRLKSTSTLLNECLMNGIQKSL